MNYTPLMPKLPSLSPQITLNWILITFFFLSIVQLRSTMKLRSSLSKIRITKRPGYNLSTFSKKYNPFTSFRQGRSNLHYVSMSQFSSEAVLNGKTSINASSIGILNSTSENEIEGSKHFSLKPRILFVLGGPGAGKGTQCVKVSDEFGIKHLSAGELLRNEISKGSANGLLIESYLKEGKIVPVKITLDLLRQEIEQSNCNRYLIDGFPRNYDNVNGWESCMTSVCNIESVMFFECPESELERRVLSRGITSGRSDDNIQAAQKRFNTFKLETVPVVEYYEKKGQVIRIDGNRNSDVVFREFSNLLKGFISKEIIELTQYLLNSMLGNDWQAFVNCSDASLTAFQEDKKDLVNGLDEYNEYFKSEARQFSCNPNLSIEMQNPIVQVMGKAAVISYLRIVKDESGVIVSECKESRVWQLIEGRWKQVHINRSSK